MPAVQIISPFEVFPDVDGEPLEDGFIYIGQATLDPETNPVSAFFDAALTVPATQPIRTKGGYPSNAGAPSRIYIGVATYSVRVKNKNSTTIYTDLNRANEFTGGTLQDALNEAPPVTIASSATVNIGVAAANTINISGTTTITAFDTIAAGAVRRLVFQGALTLTHNGTTLILPNSVNFTTQAGDTLEFQSLGSGNWTCINVHRRVSNAVAVDILAANGIIARTGAGAVAARSIVQPAAGISVTNSDGVAGNPTLALANDLAALEGLGSTGLAARSAADTWVQRSIVGTANKVTVTNGDGVAGDPTLTLPDAVTLVTPTVTGLLTVSGGQIAFPAVQIPSGGANTLDDYEEGTWTLILTFATPGDLVVAYSSQSGTYTKTGRGVSITGLLVTSTFTHTTASGDLRVTGVPFTSLSGAIAGGSIEWGGITFASAYTNVIAEIQGASSTIIFPKSGSALSASTVQAADCPTGGIIRIIGSITYPAS